MSGTDKEDSSREESDEQKPQHQTFVDQILPHEHRDGDVAQPAKNRYREGLIDLERRAVFGKY